MVCKLYILNVPKPKLHFAMKNHLLVLFAFSATLLLSCSELFQSTQSPLPPNTISSLDITIPAGGNCWVMENGEYVSSNIVSDGGISNWSNPNQSIRAFFHIKQVGKIALGIKAKTQVGTTRLKVTFGNQSQEISLEGNRMQTISLGEFQVDQAGYHALDISGIEKQGGSYADIEAILLGGLTDTQVKYIKDDFYFARNGC